MRYVIVMLACMGMQVFGFVSVAMSFSHAPHAASLFVMIVQIAGIAISLRWLGDVADYANKETV